MKSRDKLSALDPKFQEKIKVLFSQIHTSIDVLYEAATRDEKTGLYNNRFFENILDMEMEKAQRGKQKLSIMIVDIDFFKKINDTLGHIEADVLLRVLAQLIQSKIRGSDVAARFGGEEFFILLPETSSLKAKKLASRLQKAIHSDKILNKHNVTVSGGITEYKQRDSKKSFKKRADKALYKAKNSGRNKFVVI